MRILLVQRDLNDQPVPEGRKGQSVAQAAAHLARACQHYQVDLSLADTTDPHALDAQQARPDFVLVLGGDGTILRAAETARHYQVPLLGINTGHVGFLAEADPDALDQVIHAVVHGNYHVDERMTLDIEVTTPEGEVRCGWALNEAALAKQDRARMLEVSIGVDGQAVTSFGCDGVLISTPTGSTAYSFSAGGPVIWPEVEALMVVPLAAHALFTRPLVLGPGSTLSVHIDDAGFGPAYVWCDGRREIEVPVGGLVQARRSTLPVRLARLNNAPFASRLVRKLNLPITGWRGTASTHARTEHTA